MDTVNRYRQAIRQVVEKYASYESSTPEINHELVIDSERDHYEVLVIGWQNSRRVYHPMMHFDIINGKVWLQVNNTDRELTDELIELGVPREDIVLAFHPKNIRQYTGFAVS